MLLLALASADGASLLIFRCHCHAAISYYDCAAYIVARAYRQIAASQIASSPFLQLSLLLSFLRVSRFFDDCRLVIDISFTQAFRCRRHTPDWPPPFRRFSRRQPSFSLPPRCHAAS